MSSECSHQTTSWMKHEEDEQRPNNTNNKSIVVSGKGLVLFVFVSLSAMVFLSYFPLATTSSLNVLDKNAEEDDGLLLPIAKEELEEVLKEEQGRYV